MQSEDIVRSSVEHLSTTELATHFTNELIEIQERFSLADWRPTQLSGGRLGEAAIRVCQYVVLGVVDPVGKHLELDRVAKSLESAPSNCDSTFKLHIPRLVKAIYDLRNKRDVAHLGSDVSPNLADSQLVLAAGNWIASEFVRVGSGLPVSQAQRIVDSLVDRHIPLVYESAGIVRILDPTLSAKDKALILLLHFRHSVISVKELANWVGYQNVARFRTQIIGRMHAEALLHHENDTIALLPPGIKMAEVLVRRLRK